ncbi:hypothetical protein CWE21_10830 [Pseudidiomarina aquimaris]|uniref:Polysaccharide pyruvyl transferase domain-containing protein n=1 Tax=Pseudidiomarina aquimaris TaxID=641841 RepID=A0A432XD25_9GAMM|nr:hypothetical protein CWE21_10830 [Pseudidiomarina aquimaris]
MLHAIIEQFQQRGISARFVVEPQGAYERRAQFGLWQKTRAIRKHINYLAPLQLLPRSCRTQLGLVNDSDIDLVLDASGFSYGDQWPWRVAHDRLATSMRRYHKRRVPVVLLPQAFGPFREAKWQRQMQHILAYANLAYARDTTSFDHCTSLLNYQQEASVKRCPDFTNLLKPRPYQAYQPSANSVCVIPNSKMLQKRKDGDVYVNWLVELIHAIQNDEQPVFMLLHEQQQDQGLAATINARLSKAVAVVAPSDARQNKWLIGHSGWVISSRYHGLVSALSQGVPVTATGWSHKYEQLLSDYTCQDALVEPQQNAVAVWQRIHKTLNDATNYGELRARIVESGQWQREAVEKMWDEVFSLLD